MEFLVPLLGVMLCFLSYTCAQYDMDFSTNIKEHLKSWTNSPENTTDPTKDMYVIHATVYQIGILTNSTDNVTDNFNSAGNQESITLYHTNGTNVDLSMIPEPFLTNVTTQTLVGAAPILDNESENSSYALNVLSQLTHTEESPDDERKERTENFRGDNSILRLFKRDTIDNTLRVVKGAAIIPPEAGIQSISLPPLLSFNNNLTDIPVPIPNTAVVHYAKVNTLIQKP